MNISYSQQPEFNYHLLRNALSSYQKNLPALDDNEYRQVYSKAARSFELESLVIRAPEAEGVMISGQQLDNAVDALAARYASRAEFLNDLNSNRLDEEGLRHALYRELLFDAVMQRVAADAQPVTPAAARAYYDAHPEKFSVAEQRRARHILITLNPDYPENTAEAARQRIDAIQQQVNQPGADFADLATRYSECPTAMQGGQLGDVSQGQLYPQLDAALFSMEAGQISAVLESVLGFHILYCEHISPGKTYPFADVADKIQQALYQQQQRALQKAWLDRLQKGNKN